MLAIKLIFAGLVLLLVGFVLRCPPQVKLSGMMRGAFAFVASLGLTAALIGFGAQNGGIVRDGPYAQIAAHALQTIENDRAPYVLFVGASYSRNAVDDKALTRRLGARGYPQRIINFALQGASLQERDLRLRQFLRAAPMPPEAVFLEVSQRFDRHPTYGFEVAKFSERVIGQFDLRGTYWAMRGLKQSAADGMGSLAKNTFLLGLHAPINWLNIGLLNEATRMRDTAALAGYDPQQVPRRAVKAEERLAGLTNMSALPGTVFEWGASFRADQRAMLAAAGVRHIAYYFPPVIDGAERAYVKAVCESEVENICIAPTDPVMLAALDGPVWLDEEHLLAPGAMVYGQWLVEQMALSGVLGTPLAQPKLALRALSE